MNAPYPSRSAPLSSTHRVAAAENDGSCPATADIATIDTARRIRHARRPTDSALDEGPVTPGAVPRPPSALPPSATVPLTTGQLAGYSSISLAAEEAAASVEGAPSAEPAASVEHEAAAAAPAFSRVAC